MTNPYRSRLIGWLWVLLVSAGAGCQAELPVDRVRVSGHVEATEVRVAPQVGGRVLLLDVEEGQRVETGRLLARLDSADAELALARTKAERDQAVAQLRLLEAGARSEDLRVAEAQVAAAAAEADAAEAGLVAAEADVERFESLVASNSGSRKQRDDAVAARNVARDRARAATERVRAAKEALARLEAGARPEEIAAARAHVAAAAAQIATWEKVIEDATIMSPVSGIVTETLVDVGEMALPRTACVVITDLDRAWANVYVDEPDIPRIRLGQAATLYTDAGGPGIPGTVTYVSPRAEFTPRNVQTAEDRSKLVYRVKVSADNSDGVLKVGMPVEAEIPFAN